MVGWLVGWIYDISVFVGLFYAEVSLTVMIFNFIQFKNLSSQLFLIEKHFILSCNFNVLRASIVENHF